MTLTPGTRLGPYEILSPIGAGGMGEVYKARDTRLERTVAIKVLPAALSADPDRRARFEREARAISALNHPHICTLHDVGQQDGADFLVMEHVEGESLAERVQRGPLPLPQVLRHGIEIAEALDKAHRHGIVHRDLKPGNVMLTKSGVKLLDFGLARLRSAGEVEASALSELPTREKPLTEEGTLLGTLPYMAPEQLEGKEADARTDIFAFGAVLYEMATGRRAFEGKSRASLIAAILEHEPAPMIQLQPLTPPAFERAVKMCLAKDPDERWQNAHDAAAELRWLAEAAPLASPAGTSLSRKREHLAWAVAGVGGAIALTAILAHRQSEPPPVVRAAILPPDNASFEVAANEHPLALAPDGSRIAFVVRGADGRISLWLRTLSSLQAEPLAGTEDASFPFWSPDGRFLAFFAAGKLKRIPVSGGPAEVLCDAPTPRGGSWSRDGVILFTHSFGESLWSVPDSGGTTSPATRLDEKRGDISHRWPFFLPDGRHFLFFVRSAGPEVQTADVYVGELGSGEPRLLLHDASNPAYAPPGYVVFARRGTLMAQPFDLKSLTLRSEPVAVAKGIAYEKASDFADFSIAGNGTLAYRQTTARLSRLVWLDRQGKEVGSLGEPGYYRVVRLSPHGTALGVIREDPQSGDGDVWVYDAARGAAGRITFAPMNYFGVVWSPDGERLALTGSRKGKFDLFVTSANGTGQETTLLQFPTYFIRTPTDWSRDGRFLVFADAGPKTAFDLWALPLTGDPKPTPFLQTPFSETDGRLSPDGRWMAYTTNESGRPEVCVRPFPSAGARWQVSSDGGWRPRWRGDGRELFYAAPDGKLMVLDVKPSDPFEAAAARPLFTFPEEAADFELFDYDVSADGQRFLANLPAGKWTPRPITLVLNWTAELPP